MATNKRVFTLRLSDEVFDKIGVLATNAQIYIAAQTLITTQTAYHNSLKAYVNTMTGSDEIAAVQYGMNLPEPYATALAEKLAVAQSQMGAIMQRLGGNA